MKHRRFGHLKAALMVASLVLSLSATMPTASAADAGGYSVTTTVTGVASPSGAGLTPDGGQLYVSTSGGILTVINTGDASITGTVSVGIDPLAVIVSPDGSFAYSINSGDGTVSVIPTNTNTVSATIPVGTYPTGGALSADGAKLYVANYDDHTVSVIDTGTATVSATVDLGSFSPFDLAVSPDGSRVYTANANDSTVSVIDTATNTVVATVSVGTYSYAVAVSPDGSRVYTANAGDDTVSVIDTTSNTTVATVSVGAYPTGLAVSPDGSRVYTANGDGNSVSVIDTVTNSVSATVPVSGAPWDVVVSPDGLRLYTTNANGNSVSVISVSSGDAPAAPTSLVATPGDSSATVAFTAGAAGKSPITKYQYSLDGGSNWNDADPGTTSPVTVDGLDNYTTYSITLRAVSDAGPGDASAAVSVTPAHPAPAQSSPVVGSTRRSVLASWLPVSPAPGGRIKLYRATIYLAGTNTKVRTCKGGPTDTSCEMKGLTIGTAYEVRIHVVQVFGTGPSKKVRKTLASASKSITLR